MQRQKRERLGPHCTAEGDGLGPQPQPEPQRVAGVPLANRPEIRTDPGTDPGRNTHIQAVARCSTETITATTRETTVAEIVVTHAANGPG